MTQGNYISEDTNSLIRRAQQILGEVPVLDLTNWHVPTYRYLSPSCNRIEVKNVITVTDASIVKCTGSTTATCDAIPVTCSSITLGDYINMVAIVNALVAQTGVIIRFEYLENEIPINTDIIVDLVAGNNTVYAWSPNHQPSIGYTLSLYGARVL